MRCEMQNFIKFTRKKKTSNVGHFQKRDEWKRVRKIARKHKQEYRKVAR